jgi:ornithine cyclodeaminase/alanine dehydrogenase-like protein (mu-crystallin family)
MVILDEAEIRQLVDADAARQAVAEAFRVLHRGHATLANVSTLYFAGSEGLAHIKAGHLHEQGVWTVKVAADLDPGDGGPMRHGGLMLVLSALDGSLVGLLLDNGYLTELRTGAAGAIAADLLARPGASTVAIVGAGSQARYQLQALRRVRPIDRVRVVSRSAERARAFGHEIEVTHGLAVQISSSVEDAVRGADIVVTTTPSRAPLVESDWLDPGTHVTAVGADDPAKQELAPDVLARAAIVAVDDRSQAARSGELHHAVESGVRREADTVTLGELLEGVVEGRASEEDLTVADLTGVGVQDAAVAAIALHQAARGLDTHLNPGTR